MMKDQMMKEIIQAMKEKNRVKKGVLQLVKSALELAEKEKKAPLTEEEEIRIVQREVKQTKDSLEEAEKYGRDDLIAEAKERLEILANYLPQQLSEAEVKEQLVAAGITQGMNMGDAMKVAMATLAGKAENKLISKVVKELIA